MDYIIRIEGLYLYTSIIPRSNHKYKHRKLPDAKTYPSANMWVTKKISSPNNKALFSGFFRSRKRNFRLL